MSEETTTAHRFAAYSDAVFAVIVTIMVLGLKPPEEPAFAALWPLWPTVISYAVSYVFIAIIWINHHHLVRFMRAPTLGLMWINFVHLFMVSLLPFATAWVARTGSPPLLWRSTQGCSCVPILPTTSSSATFWPMRRPRTYPNACGAWQGVDRSSSWRSS